MALAADHLELAGLADQVDALVSLDGDAGADRIAIVSDPYGGRAAVAEAVAERLDGAAERRLLDTPITGVDVPDPTAADPLIVEDAHHLFARRIGGFDPLETFVDRLPAADGLVVTTWNRYAWNYLRAVRDLDRLFTRVVEVPPLGGEVLRSIAPALFGPELPEFVDRSSDGRVRTFSLDAYQVSLPGRRSVSVPYPSPNREWLAAWNRSADERPVEAAVFEKLARHARGNPGVAAAILERSNVDEEFGPADIATPQLDRGLTDDEAFLLWVVVASEVVDRAELAETTGIDRIEVALEPLRRAGLLAIEEDRVRLVPEGLPAALTALDHRGMLW